MSFATSKRAAARAALVPLVVLIASCGPRPAPADSAPVEAVGPVSTEPGEIELSDPQVALTSANEVRFEVRYRFTKGKPDKYYLCEVSFPGTPNHAAKPLESWELKSEGVIKDGIRLFKPPVEKFEIRVSETDSPQNGYKLMSNVVRGVVKQ